VAKECFDQGGNKIKRVGKASVKRALMDPVAIVGDMGAAKDYAMVHCPDADTYIVRDGEGQRSCQFILIWWADDESKTEEFEFGERDKAINKFLRLIK
jgi:hypothetical protein